MSQFTMRTDWISQMEYKYGAQVSALLLRYLFLVDFVDAQVLMRKKSTSSSHWEAMEQFYMRHPCSNQVLYHLC